MTSFLKRLVPLCLLMPVLALGQTTTTPSIGLQTPPYGTANWNTSVNFNSTQLDLYLSGNLALPALSVTGSLTAPGLTTW